MPRTHTPTNPLRDERVRVTTWVTKFDELRLKTIARQHGKSLAEWIRILIGDGTIPDLSKAAERRKRNKLRRQMDDFKKEVVEQLAEAAAPR